MRRALSVGLCVAGAAFAACGGDRGAPRGDGEPAPHELPAQGRARGDEHALPGAASSTFYAKGDGFEAFAGRRSAYAAHVSARTGRLTVATRAGDRIELEAAAIGREGPGGVLWRAGARAGAGASAPPPVELAGGRVRVRRGDVLEELEARSDGVEQRWIFDARPTGRGDLEVRLAARGRAPLSARGAALASGTLRVRDAAWVDARGARTPLALTAAASGAVSVKVPAAVVEQSAYPAVLDPTIGPEIEVDPTPVVAPHGEATYEPAVAVGKDGTALVAWADERSPSLRSNWMLEGYAIVGARVTAAGVVLDPTGLPLMTERDGFPAGQRVLYDGVKNWFVAWRESSSNTCDSLWGAVVSDDGSVLSSRRATGGCVAPALDAAFDGTDFIVVFQAGYSAGPVWATRFTAAGVPRDVLPVQLGAAAGLAGVGPKIACRAGGCLLVTSTATGPHALRLGANVAAIDAAPIVLPSGPAVDGVVYDGQRWAVAYGSLVALVDPATGAVSAPVTTAGAAPASESKGVASGGADTWLVRTNATQQAELERVTQAGALVPGGPTSLTTAAAVQRPQVAVGAAGGFVAWTDASDRSTRVVRVSPQGASLDGDGIVLGKAANRQMYPVVATNGTGFLVGWIEPSGAHVIRLDASGAPLAQTATLVDPSATVVHVASDGTDYLVGYTAGGQVSLARVSGATGAVVGPPVSVASGALLQGLSHDGLQYVVIWTSSGATRGALVSNGGIVGPTLDVAPGVSGPTAVASGAQGTLVVLGKTGVRLDRTGAVLDASPFPIITSPIAQPFPEKNVTWDGAQWVVVWEDERAGYITSSQVFAARVSAGGVVQSPAEILVGSGPSVSAFPAVVSMSDGYADLVTWSDLRSPTRYLDFGLYANWIRRSDGALIDAAPTVLSDRAGNELLSALAPAGNGRALVVYQLGDFSPGFGTTRIRARVVGSGAALGEACAADAACTTRACADGVCCDRACTGACETCAGTGGKCVSVVSAEDPDSCAGDDVCTAISTCRRKAGRGCTVDADCATGHCAQGICCDRPCDGPCEVCAPLTGTCGARPARTAGAPTCAPFACDGAQATCPATCTTDLACPAGTRCDPTTGACVSGASCLDRTRVALDDRTLLDCAPYSCVAGSCRTSCRSIEDCASATVCDERGACVPAPESPGLAGGGCAAAPTRGLRAGARDGALAATLAAAVAALRALRRRRREVAARSARPQREGPGRPW